MNTKLPKPSGLKPPQIKVSKTLESIAENGVSRAPLSSMNQDNITSRFMRRRSKSVTDLTSINRNAIDFRNLRHQISAKKGAENKAAVLTSTLNKVVSKTNTKPALNSGIKRHAAAAVTAAKKSAEDGPSKPKISKWDFKGRYNLEVEKTTSLQEKIKALSEKLEEFSDIDVLYTTVKSEAQKLAEAKQTLTAQCENLLKTNEEFRLEIDRLADIEAKHNVATACLELVTKENDKNLKELKRLTDSLQELTEKYQKLTQEHTILNENHEELVKKHCEFTENYRNLRDDLEAEKVKNSDLEKNVSHYKKDLQHYQNERRILHNTIQDLKGNIRVFCRVRPPINEEEDMLLQCFMDFKDETVLEIRKSRESVNQITGRAVEQKSEFVFDRVFGPETTQEEIFEDLSQLVQSALDGYDVCVFAYGQTGSGKTYTMQGGYEPEKIGMIPRTIDKIFEAIDHLKLSGWEYTVHVSFLEIYNENINDLLNMNGTQKLEVCFNTGKGTTVSNLTIKPMASARELKENMTLAHRNRATAATNFNEHSSRSHAVTKIYIEGYQSEQGIQYRGSINLVDLAGSENAKGSTNSDRLTETKNINKSLATLGNVMMALKSKSKHIPYRDSKLTYLLQSSLGGSSKTLMVVNVSPFEENYTESISSLRFASKVKEVKTVVKKNKNLLIKSNSMIQ